MEKTLSPQQREMLISNLKLGFEEQLKHVARYVEIAEELDVTNEQFFIDWEMKMSYLVTQDHNK